MAEGELQVRGGIGGVSAHLADLDRAAALLRQVAAELGGQARRVVAAMLDPGLQLTAPASPVTYTQVGAEAALATVGPHGLVPLAARAGSLGAGVGVVVGAYRAADRTAAEAAGPAGALLRQLLAPGLAPLVGPVIAPVLGTVLTAGLSGDVRLGRGPELFAASGWVTATVRTGTGVLPGGLPRVLERVGVPLLRLLSEHAGAVELGVPVVTAVVGGVVGGSPVAAVAAGVLTGGEGLGTVRGFARGLGALGALAAPLDGGRPWLRDAGPVRVEAHPAPWSGPPAGVTGLLSRIPDPRAGATIGPTSAPAGAELDPDRPVIHVERLDGADGRRRWVVGIPGTADWSPAATGTPFDLSGAVRLMAGERSAGMVAVAAAMRQAGVHPGEPVLLAGHSQGGLIAAALAADPALAREFTITHVVSTGAPIAAVDIPGRVQVLSLEHTDDLVPRIDGRQNRDRPTWVTASAHSPAHRPGEPPPAALRAHALAEYERTAGLIDAARDPSLVHWRAVAGPFVAAPGGTGAAWDFSVRRAAPG